VIRGVCLPSSHSFVLCFHAVISGKRFALQWSKLRRDAAETFTVTCKIQREGVGEDRVLLRVSGRLMGEHVKTLKTSLEQESGALTLDLKDVRLVDDEAVKLLVSQESNGVRIENCPLYIREWIKREREAP
jgi:hypothetical protein